MFKECSGYMVFVRLSENRAKLAAPNRRQFGHNVHETDVTDGRKITATCRERINYSLSALYNFFIG
jgi:hypothetical protein